jgi:hypothetical protein
LNRRNFLSLFGAGVAGLALDQAIPLGRVWSFPKEIVLPAGNVFLTTEWTSMETLRMLRRECDLEPFFNTEWEKPSKFRIGGKLRVKMPQRWIVHKGLDYIPQSATAAFPRGNSHRPN